MPASWFASRSRVSRLVNVPAQQLWDLGFANDAMRNMHVLMSACVRYKHIVIDQLMIRLGISKELRFYLQSKSYNFRHMLAQHHH